MRAGDVPPDADPVEVAALAYLLRPDGWLTYVEAASTWLESRTAEREEERRDTTVERLGEQLAAVARRLEGRGRRPAR